MGTIAACLRAIARGEARIVIQARGAALALGVVCVPGTVLASGSAQVTNGFADYEKRIRSAEMVGALKADLFGDSVSLYNGATEFIATDVDVPGNNALPVRLARRFKVDVKTNATLTSGGFGADIQPLGGFGDWDIDIPYLYGMFDMTYGWRVGQGVVQRCSGPLLPKVTEPFATNEVWSGYHMRIPGEGDRELTLLGTANQKPSDGNTYRWGTRDLHRGRCLSSTVNYPGEGFVFLDAQGTSYTFNYAITRDGGVVEKQGVTLQRQQVFLMATRVQDRHGNYVDYQYNGDRLNRITSSDGRAIDIYWSGNSINRVVAHGREWLYSYGSSMVVELPDHSKWQYESSGALYVTPAPPLDDGGVCAESLPGTASSFAMTITHPSGARGRFDFGYTRHGRSGTPESACTVDYIDPEWGTVHRSLKIPDYSYTYSLLSKKITGPGLSEMQWTYSWDDPETGRANFGGAYCSFCDPDRSAFVHEPNGVTKQYVFGALWNHNEGRLLGTYTRDAANSLVRSEVNGYVSEQDMQNGMPFPDRHGEFTASDNVSGLYNRPIKLVTISQDGDVAPPPAYSPPPPPPPPPPCTDCPPPPPPDCDPVTHICVDPMGAPAESDKRKAKKVPKSNHLASSSSSTSASVAPTNSYYRVDSFDAFARALQVTRYNSWHSRTDATSYHDNFNKWAIGQTAKVTNVNTGLVVSETQYNGNDLPWKTYSFGKLQQTLGYNTDGTLATATDGRNLTTTLSNWKRGIPQSIQYADSTSKSAVVNDNGTIASVTDQNGFATSYSYDAMGRLAGIAHPGGDSTAWNTVTFAFNQVGGADRGLAAGHWRQDRVEGNRRTHTYFDGLWRPVMVLDYDTADGNIQSQTIKRYDSSGRLTFQSYPTRHVGDFNQSLSGTWTSYDALDRVTTVKQDSEHGQLTTTTEYLPGFQTRLTNPRGLQVTAQYQVYDQPTADSPTGITTSADTATEIHRDVFGKPTLLVRRNHANTQRLERRYVYDVNQQLCKTIEPEVGSTVMGYDGAGNLAWSAAGHALPDAGNCNQAEGYGWGRRVDRSYDARNRLSTLGFPDGRGNQTWTYTPDGLPATITTYNDPGNGAPVVNGYSYNKRRLLTGESNGQTGWYTWGIGYGYNANGALATNTYPTGLVVQYAPNALGQATSVTSPDGWTYASGVQYYPNGAISQFTYGNGIVHTMSQNARQLPSRTTDAGAINYSYAYDYNGNPTHIADDQQGAHFSRWMAYDGLDRLTDAGSCSFGGDCWHRYTYDALDNLKSWKLPGVKDYANYYYESGTNRLTLIQDSAGAGVVGLSYDAQGNLANKNGQNYGFDYGNRLRETSGKEWYRYDGHGRRVLNWRWSEVGVLSIYSQSGQLFYDENYRASGRKASEYVYLSGSLIASRARNIDNNTWDVRFQHTDALGSPVAASNTAGQVIERTQYEPYGAAIGKPNYDGIGYTGHVMDGATGLTYMQQRYYDPSIGRFLSVDPVTANSNTGGNFNRYWYANNNPYKFFDPDGRLGCTGSRIQSVCDSGGVAALRTSARSPMDTGDLKKLSAANPAPNVRLREGVQLKDNFVRNDLQALSDSVGGKDVDVISGYRSQEKQDTERAAGNRRAAKSSQHTLGRAADVKIKGMTQREVGKAAFDLGRFERVNVYSAPGAGVHVDYRDVGEGTQMYNDWRRVDPP